MTHSYGLHALFGVVTCLISAWNRGFVRMGEYMLWLVAVRCVCCCGSLQCVVYVVMARCSALCMLLWPVAVRCVCGCGSLQCVVHVSSLQCVVYVVSLCNVLCVVLCHGPFGEVTCLIYRWNRGSLAWGSMSLFAGALIDRFGLDALFTYT